ncbi:MAG TPA: NHL repeat-containing protein [Longimicrobiaceae bacterium]|nr:NHL repeat-containing protein [Longimicrobiaceae bacterium]
MPVRLQCPACSAPLDVPDTHAATTRCPYCGTGVLLTERSGRIEASVLEGQRGRAAPSATVTWVIGAAVILLVVGGVALLAIRPGGDPPAPDWPVPARAAAPVPPPMPEPPQFAEPVLRFGSEGVGAGRFTDARSVAVDGQGRIYVAEYSGGRVQVFDSLGTFLTQWTADPKKPLVDLEADRGGTVYVVQSGEVRRYEGATGQPLGRLASGGRATYSDIALAPDGTFWAVTWPHDIVHLGRDGSVLRTIDVREAIGDDASPARVAVAGTGDLFVTDQHTGEVYRLDRSGRFVDRFGGQRSGSFSHVAVDGRGRVYVGELGSGIRVFGMDGRQLASFGDGLVFGIAVNDRDEIFAAFRNRHEVVKFRPRE